MIHLKLQVLITGFFLLNNLSFSQGWVQQTSSTNSNLNCVYFINSTTGFVGGETVILKTTNSGFNWININSQNLSSIYGIQFVDNLTGFASTSNKVYKTVDGGVSWDTTINGGGKNIFFINNALGYSSINNNPFSIFRTTNSGNTWNSIFLNLTNYESNNLYFIDEFTGYASGSYWVNMFAGLYSARIWKTTNAGMNWENSYTSTLSTYFSAMNNVIFTNSEIGYAIGYYGTPPASYVLKSSNAGINWISMQSISKMISMDFVGNDTGWFCGWDGKIYYTSNGCELMQQQISNVNSKLSDIFMLNISIGFIVGDNGTILKTTNGGITAVGQIGTAIPEEFSLSQNYPNPFNPTTQISFDIPKASFVTLVVYDGLGREIEQMVNQQLSPGSYNYDWDASSYPSGIYFYRLQAGDPSTKLSVIETKKMVLIK